MVPQPRVQVVKQHLITPSEPTPIHQKRVKLSDWDVVMFKSYTPLLLFYPNKDNTPNFMDTPTLKSALAKVLVSFYPLAGRLLDIGNGRDVIECTDTGVLFEEAVYNDRLERFRAKGYLPTQIDYHHMFPVHFYSSPDDPLLAIRLIRFTDGGVALAIMMLHKIADTYSTSLFLDCWAKTARGVDYTKPSFKRDLVKCPDNTVIGPESLEHYRQEHQTTTHNRSRSLLDTHIKLQPTNIVKPPPLKSVLLEFYSDGLQACKKDAHTPEMIQAKQWLSTKDALFAMLLRALARSRHVDDDEEIKWVVSVNGRSRMKNSKEMNFYFGNWMMQVVTRTLGITKNSLEKTSLVDTACNFRQMMANLKASVFHGLSQLYTTHEDMTVHYLSYQPNTPTHHTVSDVSMLPFWRLDFGFGGPDRTRGYITFGGNGCLVLFGRSENTKGPIYDIQLQMDEQSMRKFIEDPDIVKYTHAVIY
ncbi:transferase [Phycomyces blakesleeanus]|uniref:Transferase n=1 Tax=Phycomyces blakesleeanus TaxID=4837 RepID=A0ABR3AM08_PHYBL